MLQPVQEVCESLVADPLPQRVAFLVVGTKDVVSRVLGLDFAPVVPQIVDLGCQTQWIFFFTHGDIGEQRRQQVGTPWC